MIPEPTIETLFIGIGAIAIFLVIYIYLIKKSKKLAQKKFEKKKKDLEKSIKKEYSLELREWKNKYEEKIRKDATKRSDFTLSGKVAENLAPITKEFDHDLNSLRHLGTPIDYIAFDNYGTNNETKIYFLEIKSGNSGLSSHQKELREAIDEGRVFWETIRFN